MPRAGESSGRRRRVNTIAAAARIGVALQNSPKGITMLDAARILLATGDQDFDTLDVEEKAYWRNRARSIIDSISLVGGLPVYEDKAENGRVVYFLLSL